MAWFIEDFALLAVILRAATLSLQSLLLGGIVFTLLAVPGRMAAAAPALLRCCRWIARLGLAIAVPAILTMAIDSAVLAGTAHLPLSALVTADYFIAGTLSVIAGFATYFIARKAASSFRSLPLLCAPFAGLVVTAVWSSHAVSRLEHRVVLCLLTGLHQVAAAAWIGGIAFLLISFAAQQDMAVTRVILRRFSRIALSAAALLIGSGICLSWYYVGSWPALYGTAYGYMLIVKVALLCSLLLLATLNWSLSRSSDTPAYRFGVNAVLLVRRMAEVETAIGLTIVLAASSLTSQPPAVDLTDGRLSWQEIVQRFTPQVPRFTSPGVADLAPPTPLEVAVLDYDNAERAAAHQQRDPDIAWSEYSHHWAGIILFFIGVGAFLAHFPRCRWARHWPLGFIALAIFSFLRGDPENWPLGPISFWKSFYDPEVLTHRLYDVVFVFYAGFEWGVQTGRLTSRWAARVFPVMLALGGAGLLLHNHALGNAKDELLIEMNHNVMGVLAVFAGLGRWLELQLPESPARRFAGYLWPVFLVLIGCMLLIYREA